MTPSSPAREAVVARAVDPVVRRTLIVVVVNHEAEVPDTAPVLERDLAPGMWTVVLDVEIDAAILVAVAVASAVRLTSNELNSSEADIHAQVIVG